MNKETVYFQLGEWKQIKGDKVWAYSIAEGRHIKVPARLTFESSMSAYNKTIRCTN